MTGQVCVRLINHGDRAIVMNHDFILIRNRILDYKVYREEFKQFSDGLLWHLASILEESGFKEGSIRTAGYSLHSAKFYKQDMDMEITLTICKKNEEVFV